VAIIDLNDYTNSKISVSTMPAKAKYIPFLNRVVPGMNIKKVEKTKKKNDIPKKIFNTNKES
jgi:SOS-response transcriptional repressor LexA